MNVPGGFNPNETSQMEISLLYMAYRKVKQMNELN